MSAPPRQQQFAGVPPRKTKWSSDEDNQLRRAIQDYGLCSWTKISRCVPNRNGKQCRERWLSQLAPTVSKDIWSPAEDAALMLAHATTGNKWSIIAISLPGRSPLNVKNRWNWLTRHAPGGDRPGHWGTPPAIPGVIERRKPSTVTLAPLDFEAQLFGTRFEEFQAKMFMN
jgi:hypothetical protein